MYYLADFSKMNQTEQSPKKESELKKWGRAGALMTTGGLVVPVGGVLGSMGARLAEKKKLIKIPKNKSYTNVLAGGIWGGSVLAGGALAGAGAYGTYRAGKAIYNRVLKRGKNNDNR